MSRSRAFGLALALILAAGSAVAEDTGVAVADAWARATPGGAKAGAVYFTVSSAQPDRLLAVQSPGSLEDLLLSCYLSDDFKEGARAFLEKRKANWKGR